jgi:RHS repeat-associated protein
VDQQTLGTSGSEAYVTDAYDPHTDALANQLVTRSTSIPTTDVDDEAYTYNADQQITSSTDTRLGATATSETQCYTYDTQDRLNAAWTATDDCATTPSTGNDSTVSDALGTADAYWSTWSFTPTGQRNTETDYATGNTAVTTTTTTSDVYNGTDAGQPHTLTGTTTTIGTTPGGATTGSTSYGYDADGNMTARTTAADGSQSLSWNNQDKLTAVNGSANGSASFLYDADGSLLVQTDGASTTLYTADEEITYNSTSATTTALRYYALPGGGTVVRTAAGTNYSFEITNQQGTAELYLDSTCQIPTWRQFTPYGAPRGTTTTWIDNRGFLNQPTDTITGLTLDGARAYDPTIGSFVSLDPLFEATSTEQLNGYSYAGNNPIDGSDSTGLIMITTGPGGLVGSPQYIDSMLQRQHQQESTCDWICQQLGFGNDYTQAYYNFSDYNENLEAQTEGFNVTAAYAHIQQENQSFGENFGGILRIPYSYSYSEELGSASELGSPAQAMSWFEANPTKVFPFPVTGCSSFSSGASCTLHPGAGVLGGIVPNTLDGGTGTVRVSLDSATKFSFTVTSQAYFDPPGSSISFAISQRGGNLYLSQNGSSPGADIFDTLGVDFGLARSEWQKQADNLRWGLMTACGGAPCPPWT